MKYSTFYLKQRQYDWLADNLPQPKPSGGRLPTPNKALLNGILYVLKTGCRWQDIPRSVCVHNPSTCWRRFNYWRKQRSIITVWQSILSDLDDSGTLDLSVGNIDGSLVQSPKFRNGTGYSGKHHRIGTNVLLTTDKNGLPLSTHNMQGNRHDSIGAEKVIKKIRVGAKKRVKQMNGDKGFDSKKLRNNLRKRGIKANIPERQFKRRRKKGRPPVYDQTKAKFRAFVERTFAWLKYFRRLRYRWERKAKMFQAFVDLGCLLICLKRVEGLLQ